MFLATGKRLRGREYGSHIVGAAARGKQRCGRAGTAKSQNLEPRQKLCRRPSAAASWFAVVDAVKP